MGAKSSKTEQLTRRKSFSTLGRSSQRSLFQKSKIKLNRISKQIDNTAAKADAAALEGITTDLDVVEKELNGISDAVKLKNQEKYDDICRYLQNTRKKYGEKFNVQEVPEPVEDTNEIILRNATVETSNDVEFEEPKKHCVTFRETISEESFSFSEEPKKPSVKFGVQVLPPSPQSQVLLKRKTYPTNSPPKIELLNRNTTDGGFLQLQNGTSSKVTIQTTNSFNSKTVSQSTEYSAVSKRRYLKSNSILGIEAINNEVNELETELKYFTGSKNSKTYEELHQGFVNNLALVDSIDDDDDPITKQEKRILKQRINELLKILECLVEQINGDCDDQFSPANTPTEKIEEHPKFLSPVTAI